MQNNCVEKEYSEISTLMNELQPIAVWNTSLHLKV